MKRIILLFLSFSMVLFVKAQDSMGRDRLWQSFLSPPDSVKVECYYYWVKLDQVYIAK